jgi:hypothetical protein
MTRSGGTIRRKFTAKSNGTTSALDAEAVAERQLARQLARAETPANIEHLKQIADNPDSSSADRIRAMRLLAEIGGMVGRDRPDEVPLLNVPLTELSREEIVIRAWHEMQSLVQRHRCVGLPSTSAIPQRHFPTLMRSSWP